MCPCHPGLIVVHSPQEPAVGEQLHHVAQCLFPAAVDACLHFFAQGVGIGICMIMFMLPLFCFFQKNPGLCSTQRSVLCRSAASILYALACQLC